MTTNYSDDALHSLARELGHELNKRGLMLVTAESCTGGWAAKVMTDIEGSSDWFERGFITYTNQSKQDMLCVDAQIIEDFGAVSEQTVQAMAEGALQQSQADISVAITGIAGPSGGTPYKPVGLVWFAWAQHDHEKLVREVIFDGDRETVRRQAVRTALEGVRDIIAR